jgi:hypothetical protein
MRLADVSRLAALLDGVAERRRGGLPDWRYRGRLVARQLDGSHIVIRASFDFRDFLIHSFPETFSVPSVVGIVERQLVSTIASGDVPAGWRHRSVA